MYQTPPGSQAVTLDVVDRWLVRACESLLTTWDAVNIQVLRGSCRQVRWGCCL